MIEVIQSLEEDVSPDIKLINFQLTVDETLIQKWWDEEDGWNERRLTLEWNSNKMKNCWSWNYYKAHVKRNAPT